MLTLLARLFIPNRQDLSDPKVHRAYGFLCSCLAIFLNLVLVVSKLLAAHFSRSASIRADAINNLSDAGSSVMLMLAFYFAGMKPQPHRPFGHGRIEYVAGFIVAGLILLLGAELAKSSVLHILHPEPLQFSWAVAGTLVASIGVKCYMGLYMLLTSRKIHSSALRSTGMDSFSDTFATGATLVSLLVFHFTPGHLNLDGWLELVVSLLILKAGYEAAKDPLLQLLGTTPDPGLVQRVQEICRSYPEVVGIHDLVVHDYGPGRLHISVHCEVPGDQDIFQLHEAMDNAMAEMDRKLGCISVIHMDPICTNDERLDQMRTELSRALESVGHDVHIHDFRVVTGPTRDNVIFDCVVPYDVEPDVRRAEARIKEIVHSLWPKANPIVQVDRPFT
ncbi:MAG: cation diffusion facilitator family transporter [Oligosphaeraceae bacterium]